MTKEFYTVREFAMLTNVSIWTAYRAIKSGRLHAIRIGASDRGTLRIPHSEIQRLAYFEIKKILNKEAHE